MNVNVVLLNGESVSEELGHLVLSQLNQLGSLSGEVSKLTMWLSGVCLRIYECKQAQFLKAPITSVEKWHGSGHVLIVAVDEASRQLVGYLKYGRKDLYFYSRQGAVRQLERCLCLLDFYVLAEQQRGGVGRRLCDQMLLTEAVAPHQVAYDRPSPKLLPFLLRHYQLSNPDAQPNKYTIFPGFLPDDMRWKNTRILLRIRLLYLLYTSNNSKQQLENNNATKRVN